MIRTFLFGVTILLGGAAAQAAPIELGTNELDRVVGAYGGGGEGGCHRCYSGSFNIGVGNTGKGNVGIGNSGKHNVGVGNSGVGNIGINNGGYLNGVRRRPS